MKHTTHYRVTVNHLNKIITIDKPLETARFFQNPHTYCESEDTKTRALIHYTSCREEHYFRNLEDAWCYFMKLRKNKYYTEYLFNNVYE